MHGVGKIIDIYDKRIDELVDQGYLMRKYSEDGKLVLFNYSDACLYDKVWNDITINSRGHVYDAVTGDLVALPFSKFFNLSELPMEEQKELLSKKGYSITEKMDGSLILCYNYERKWRVNSRGSFNSDQSQEATKIVAENYDLSRVPTNYTIVTEVIYPENQIVINYGKERKLVLLAIFNRESGLEEPRHIVEMISNLTRIPLVKEYNLTMEDMFKWQEEHNTLDQEGFVVKFQDGKRVKIKSKRYLEVAKLLANLTYKHLWENMEDGRVDEALVFQIPEEFRTELNEMVNFLEQTYFDIYTEVLDECKKAEGLPRKEIAARTDLKHKSGVFFTIDQRWWKVEEYLMKRLKEKLPKTEKREDQES